MCWSGFCATSDLSLQICVRASVSLVIKGARVCAVTCVSSRTEAILSLSVALCV